jgi:hypothetical protein
MPPRAKCDCGTCARCVDNRQQRERYARKSPEEKAAIRRANAEPKRRYERKRAKTEKWKAYRRDRIRRWRLENPEKIAAHRKVENALRRGREVDIRPSFVREQAEMYHGA